MMGSGTWDKNIYDRVSKAKIDSGTTFVYTSHAKRYGLYEAHKNLRVLDDDCMPVTRESRDSDEHPESTPIVVGFDVTGSMGGNPAILQNELKGLFGMLIRKDIVSDPQIAIGAYGDTNCDRVPVQLSQFESDNRIDDNLDNVFIEGGGGGNGGETSTALAWFVARHVVTDSLEKRGKKGYVFLIGDECALEVETSASKMFLGERQPFVIYPKMAFDELQKGWNVYFLLVNNMIANMQGSEEKYKRLLGSDHVIVLESTESAPAVIASVIGYVENTVTSDTLEDELTDAGFSSSTAIAAAKATSKLAAGGHGKVTRTDDGYGDLGL